MRHRLGPSRVNMQNEPLRAYVIIEASFKRTVLMATALTAASLIGVVYGDTRIARGGKWTRQGRTDIEGAAPSFVLGTTKPDATNTGPRVAYTQTFGAPGSRYTFPCATAGLYERLRIYGTINVTAVTGVIIQDCTIYMTQPPASASIFGILFNDANAHDNLVQFCLITVPDAADRTEWVSAGLRGRGFTAYRCHISYTTDGVSCLGKAGATQLWDVSIQGCYLHDFTDRFSASLGTTHNDGVQCFGSINLYIIGCTIYGGNTSCIILNYNTAMGYGIVEILNNWLHGDIDEGATINISTSSQAIPTLHVWGNRVDPTGFDDGQISVQTPNRIPANFGATSGTSNGIVSDWVYGSNKNYYMDDGSEVRIQMG